MKLKLFLDIDSYECMVNQVPHEALSRAALDAAVLLGHTRIVDCEETEARELLAYGVTHCPDAVHRIAEAMRAAGIIA
jgi:hypothetical protein